MHVSLNRQLRDRLDARDAAIVPGAADALVARLIADAGFEAVYVTGAGVANAFLGAPDLGLVTATELVDHVATIREAVDLPLIVDADTGFGGPLNVRRTVRALERAGANAIQLEDQVFPKRCGHFAGTEVVSTAEMVQRIRAATDARIDDDLVIIARTDARASEGLDAALARAAAYVDAGADATFVEAPGDAAELERIATTLPVPQVANMVAGGRTPLLPQDELRAMGFAVILYANTALQAALKAMADVLGHLRTKGDLDGVLEQLIPFDERQRLVGKPAYDELEASYTDERD